MRLLVTLKFSMDVDPASFFGKDPVEVTKEQFENGDLYFDEVLENAEDFQLTVKEVMPE